MEAAEWAIVAANVVLLGVFAVPMAGALRRTLRPSGRLGWWVMAAMAVYLAEAAAFSASMATNIIPFALALVWGLWLRRRLKQAGTDRATSKRLAKRFALYTCLPAISLAVVFVFLPFSDWNVFSVADGRRFGIPELVPWPMNTVLGFFAAVIGSAVVVKVFLTIALAVPKCAHVKVKL